MKVLNRAVYDRLGLTDEESSESKRIAKHFGDNPPVRIGFVPEECSGCGVEIPSLTLIAIAEMDLAPNIMLAAMLRVLGEQWGV
jgi:hypothetical protein